MSRQINIIINLLLFSNQLHMAKLPQLTAAMEGINKRGVSRSRGSDYPSKKRQLSMEEAVTLKDRFTQEKGRQIWRR